MRIVGQAFDDLAAMALTGVPAFRQYPMLGRGCRVTGYGRICECLGRMAEDKSQQKNCTA
jgi:hypothetical protein